MNIELRWSIVFVFHLFAVYSYANTSTDRIDSLVLNDGSTLVGTIADTFAVTVYEEDMNRYSTKIKDTKGVETVVPNDKIVYYYVGGVQYKNVPLQFGGNRFMLVLDEGAACLYRWFGSSRSQEKGFYNIGETPVVNVLIINGKTYTPNPTWLKKHFEDLFGACPKLVSDAKDGSFAFGSILPIVKQYNACMGKVYEQKKEVVPGH